MIALLTLALVGAAVTYLATHKLRRKWRLIAGALAFMLLGVAPLTYIVIVGDHPPADAQTVTLP